MDRSRSRSWPKRSKNRTGPDFQTLCLQPTTPIDTPHLPPPLFVQGDHRAPTDKNASPVPRFSILVSSCLQPTTPIDKLPTTSGFHDSRSYRPPLMWALPPTFTTASKFIL